MPTSYTLLRKGFDYYRAISLKPLGLKGKKVNNTCVTYGSKATYERKAHLNFFSSHCLYKRQQELKNAQGRARTIVKFQHTNSHSCSMKKKM